MSSASMSTGTACPESGHRWEADDPLRWVVQSGYPSSTRVTGSSSMKRPAACHRATRREAPKACRPADPLGVVGSGARLQPGRRARFFRGVARWRISHQIQPLVWINDGAGRFTTLKAGRLCAGRQRVDARNWPSRGDPERVRLYRRRISAPGSGEVILAGLLATKPYRISACHLERELPAAQRDQRLQQPVENLYRDQLGAQTRGLRRTSMPRAPTCGSPNMRAIAWASAATPTR